MKLGIDGRVVFHKQLTNKEDLLRMVTYVLDSLVDVDNGKAVAVVMKRTPLMFAALFALYTKRIPFLPIDLSCSEERLEYMLENAKIGAIISDSIERLCGRKTIRLNYDYFCAISTNIPPYNSIEEYEEEDGAAYILYTSGTTGFPKAVEVLRSGLENFVDGVKDAVWFPDESRIASLTNISFDIFFLESIVALTLGMTVVLADEYERNNPRLVNKLIVETNVNVLQCTPSTFHMLEMVDPDMHFLSGIQTLMIGGEPFPTTMLSSIQKGFCGKIYNMYGPTETTIWSSVSELTYASCISIGKPILNTKFFIVDENLKRVAKGCEGEILIAGRGLAKGYLYDESRTEKAFITLDLGEEKIRAYRTGDYGFLSDDGNYVCLGRRDGQVKVLGHRIELGDIEYHVGRIPGIINNVVVNISDENILICFYISDRVLSKASLRNEALKFLPDYMVPNEWIHVPEILYTGSGKTDRKAMVDRYRLMSLVEMDKESPDGGNDEKIDEIIGTIIDNMDVVGKEGICCSTKLMSLGLDSYKYVACLVHLEEIYNMEFEDEMLSAKYFDTLEDIAVYILHMINQR